jgi:hypothetical protein
MFKTKLLIMYIDGGHDLAEKSAEHLKERGYDPADIESLELHRNGLIRAHMRREVPAPPGRWREPDYLP